MTSQLGQNLVEFPSVTRPTIETEVIDSRPGAVRLARSALHPGGGGQVSDRGTLEHVAGLARIIGVEIEGEHHWHRLDSDMEIQGTVLSCVSTGFPENYGCTSRAT